MSDDLATRPGLPEPYRYLLADLPRERWHGHEIAAMARFWLQMHAGFRCEVARMDALIDQWRSGTLALPDLHRQLIPTLQGFLQHLEGHHNIETHHYFPTMRRVEPRIGSGIDLLDRDHDVIHGHLESLFQTGLAFHQGISAKASTAGDAAARLGDALDAAGPVLGRHLEDEEDIVVPLITRHAQVFSG
ncbi:hemerythrin domain-containing protein [Brevundimonas subvibrioides]|uniref:hemerythrin domain-containing protein n=1 Tax=Brevundimonas subvibrioides TaxID=74313 RepID=UPI0022B5D6B2|nr:hemerythrin domain-containing protein [Brevundimonas subvibrioides]